MALSPSPQPPRQHKSAGSEEVCASGAAEAPGQRKHGVGELIWRLEAVRATGDAEVARIAEAQRGIVARAQLIQAGLSAAAIKHRLGMGHLHVLYPGVYLFGRTRLEPLAAETAAIAYLNGRAVLSHHSAAKLWGLLDPVEPPVHITVVGACARSRPGLVVHRAVRVDPQDVRAVQGLPSAAAARTVVDLAGVRDLHDLEAVLALALRRRLVTATAVRAALARAPKSKGSANLRRLLNHESAPTLTRSKYERKMIELIRRAELPTPRANAKVQGMEVDLLWPEQRFIVEFDGFGYHSSRRSFEDDRLRDQRLTAAGYRVIRITARQLDHTPEAVIARLAAALVHR